MTTDMAEESVLNLRERDCSSTNMWQARQTQSNELPSDDSG